MPDIRPFRALRYDPRAVPDLAQVVAPPYDVISPDAQERLYRRHPYNVVRLILPTDKATRSASDRYTRAGETFTAWRRQGILRRDPTPAVYLYEQEFAIDGLHRHRRGLLTLVRLHEYTDRVIFPHERTFARYKDDRLQLMRACSANLEAILAFYPGPADTVAALFDHHAEATPTVRLVDDEGVGHRVWLVQDPGELAALQMALREQPLIIADGHHRYETALNFLKERRTDDAAAGSAEERRPERFVLADLVAADDPGLAILPTHRVVRPAGCVGEDVIAALGRHFAIHRIPLEAGNPLGTLRAVLAALAPREDAAITCVVYAGGPDLLRLELTDPSATRALLAEGRAPAVAHLDVAVLHRILIEGLLGIPSDAGSDDRIQYTRDEAQAFSAVATGDAALALFLNAPRVETVRAVAMAGDRMPQKSTFFFPKVLSGLVINPLDADEGPSSF